MKHKWRFFGFFVIYSFVLSILWYMVYADYIRLPVTLAGWFLDFWGYSGDIVEVAQTEAGHFIRFPDYAPGKAYTALNMVFNVVPYLALCLATPRATWVRKVEVALYGLAVLILLHVASIVAVFYRVATAYFWKDAVYYFFATLMEALAPILLWLAFMGKNFFFRRRP